MKISYFSLFERDLWNKYLIKLFFPTDPKMCCQVHLCDFSLSPWKKIALCDTFSNPNMDQLPILEECRLLRIRNGKTFFIGGCI